jgi:hypothetical protein
MFLHDRHFSRHVNLLTPVRRDLSYSLETVYTMDASTALSRKTLLECGGHAASGHRWILVCACGPAPNFGAG